MPINPHNLLLMKSPFKSKGVMGVLKTTLTRQVEKVMKHHLFIKYFILCMRNLSELNNFLQIGLWLRCCTGKEKNKENNFYFGVCDFFIIINVYQCSSSSNDINNDNNDSSSSSPKNNKAVDLKNATEHIGDEIPLYSSSNTPKTVSRSTADVYQPQLYSYS